MFFNEFRLLFPYEYRSNAAPAEPNVPHPPFLNSHQACGVAVMGWCIGMGVEYWDNVVCMIYTYIHMYAQSSFTQLSLRGNPFPEI
jgi:hypothetical protein